MRDILKAEGITGQIEVSDGVISITRKGLRAKLSQGKKGELSIPVGRVTKVNYKKASFLTNGHIHFLLKGKEKDSHVILNCPLTVIFNRKQEGEFRKIAKLVSELKDKGAKDSKYEGPPMVEAIKYAQKRGAQMAAKYELTPSTGERIAQIVSDGIKNKRGIPGISRDIRGDFPDISKARADNIAQTETATALSKASLDRMQDMGIDGKEWVTAGDDRVCEICLDNQAAGVIPIDKVFPSGHMHPPGCENCRCALAPAMLNRKD